MNQTNSDTGSGRDAAQSQNPPPDNAACRFTRWASAKPWIVLVVTVMISFSLIRSIWTPGTLDRNDRIAVAILMCGVYLALWMLACRLEHLLNWSAQSQHATTSTWKSDWKSAPWWGIGFCMAAFALSQNGGNQHNQTGSVPPSNEAIRTLSRGQATAAYWSTAVTDLHLIRFEIPSGPQSAAESFDQRFGQLRTLTGLAKTASTVNVDPQLVQMASRHLALDEDWLLLKQQFDQLMKQKPVSTDASTVDQQSFVWNAFLLAMQSDPHFIEKLPRGPERDLIESVLVLEQQRVDQLREIEQLQAVLQERYKGSRFPLPSIDQ